MGIYGKQGRAIPPSSQPENLRSLAVLSPEPPLAAPTPQASAAAAWSDDSLRHSAAEAVRQQQYPWALVLLNQLVDRHPERAAYYSNRGLVHLWCSHHDAALRDFDQAIALSPNLDQAYNNRASCYAAMGQLDQALKDYEQAVELNPFNTRARVNLGVTLRDLGHLEAALTCLDDALLFYQLAEHIYAERGRTYHLRGDWNCALADYRRCLEAIAQAKPSSTLDQLGERVKGWIDTLITGRAESSD